MTRRAVDGSGAAKGPEPDLALRFGRHLSGLPGVKDGQCVIVAVSGGLDSLVLLHLLRFGIKTPDLDLVVAHFDHAMREGSRGDALWVRGICRAWGVPFEASEADGLLRSENQAREARYRYLIRVKNEREAHWILTAHQADDQAETVLFRALRGTGLRGLTGIPARRSPGILRPLLPFSRAEIQEYAETVGLRPREDPSNESPEPARNLIRGEVLPLVEEGFAPRARESLRRLARLARQNEAAWDSLTPELLRRISGGKGADSEGTDVIARPPLLEYHPAVQSRLLREWLRRRGILLDEAGTRRLLEFTSTGSSGRSFQLPGNLCLVREFDTFALTGESVGRDERALAIPDPGPGSGGAVIGGRQYDVTWGETVPPGASFEESFSSVALRFPLRLRGWAPGDRIGLGYGSKKLKKLFSEARVARGERGGYPVLIDSVGRVLWVAGLARSILALPEPEENPMTLGLTYVRDD